MSEIMHFKKIFIEESLDSIQTSEDILINSDESYLSLDDINSIFRTFHSVKGGAATFDMPHLLKLSHSAENLLDLARSSKLTLSDIHIKILLKAIDRLKDGLHASPEEIIANSDVDVDLIKEIENSLTAKESLNPVNSFIVKDMEIFVWNIIFKPSDSLFGNEIDLYSVFLELKKRLNMKAKVNYDNLPNLVDYEPDKCYLEWEIEASGPMDAQKIKNEFALFMFDTKLLEVNPLERRAKREKSTKAIKASKNIESSHVRVSKQKIDSLLNIAGELVIVQSMLQQNLHELGEHAGDILKRGIESLERNIRELRDTIMQIRMVPISVIFRLAPRTVYDLCNQLGKKIELEITGESTELDKNVLEKIGDPINHILRNAIDHGIEMPADRIKAGKIETGRLKLGSYYRGSNIVIEIADDGKGLNLEAIKTKAKEKGLLLGNDNPTQEELTDLIFHPGFSTAQTISEVSGRGVGMDVVKKNIQQIGGAIEIESNLGKGSIFRLILPLTLAIVEGQGVSVLGNTYIIPLDSMLESVQIDKKNISQIGNNSLFYLLRDEIIPIISLAEMFYGVNDLSFDNSQLLVIVKNKNVKFGLVVNDLLSQSQIVIKSLEENYKKIKSISAATIMGNGKVSLILDVAEIYSIAIQKSLLFKENGIAQAIKSESDLV